MPFIAIHFLVCFFLLADVFHLQPIVAWAVILRALRNCSPSAVSVKMKKGVKAQSGFFCILSAYKIQLIRNVSEIFLERKTM